VLLSVPGVATADCEGNAAEANALAAMNRRREIVLATPIAPREIRRLPPDGSLFVENDRLVHVLRRKEAQRRKNLQIQSNWSK
jgi:hypothetical protein